MGNKMKKSLLIVLTVLIVYCGHSFAEDCKIETSVKGPADTLVVLWTSDDTDVAERVALMYTHAAAVNHWFKHVILIVWGPSAHLLANNSKIQSKITEMIGSGIQVQACVVCADSYGVSDKLRELNIEVTGMGLPLTNYLKKGYPQLHF
jgi:hypothetical protein